MIRRIHSPVDAPRDVLAHVERLGRQGVAYVPFLTPRGVPRPEKQFAAIRDDRGGAGVPVFPDESAGRKRIDAGPGFNLEFFAHSAATLESDLLPMLERMGLQAVVRVGDADVFMPPAVLNDLLIVPGSGD